MICEATDRKVTAAKVSENLDVNPGTLFLTATRNTATQVNKFVIQHLFAAAQPIMTVTNSDGEEMVIYQSMRLVITENRY